MAGSASAAWCSERRSERWSEIRSEIWSWFGAIGELEEHHERVLVVVLVVARADVDAAEAGALVERDGRGVAAADLEGGVGAAEGAGLGERVGEQAGAGAGAPAIGVRGDRVDVELVDDDPVVA